MNCWPEKLTKLWENRKLELITKKSSPLYYMYLVRNTGNRLVGIESVEGSIKLSRKDILRYWIKS